MSRTLPAPGFGEPVLDAQHTFRAVLEAMARPARPQPLDPGVTPPAPLGAVAGAILLTLVDEQSPVWLDTALSQSDEVTGWIRFHTGARIVGDPADAAFAFASSPGTAPAPGDLADGTDEEPHRSATLVIDVCDAAAPSSSGTGTDAGGLVAAGPGIDGTRPWDGVGLPAGFLEAWCENARRFPRGVDVILAGHGEVTGLPRTTVLTEGAC